MTFSPKSVNSFLHLQSPEYHYRHSYTCKSNSCLSQECVSFLHGHRCSFWTWSCDVTVKKRRSLIVFSVKLLSVHLVSHADRWLDFWKHHDLQHSHWEGARNSSSVHRAVMLLWIRDWILIHYQIHIAAERECVNACVCVCLCLAVCVRSVSLKGAEVWEDLRSWMESIEVPKDQKPVRKKKTIK